MGTFLQFSILGNWIYPRASVKFESYSSRQLKRIGYDSNLIIIKINPNLDKSSKRKYNLNRPAHPHLIFLNLTKKVYEYGKMDIYITSQPPLTIFIVRIMDQMIAVSVFSSRYDAGLKQITKRLGYHGKNDYKTASTISVADGESISTVSMIAD